jgi:dienelactone hydrolase
VQVVDEPVRIPVGTAELTGELEVPAGADALVLFAHGSGSSRHSPRNRFVAESLRWRGVGTLLFDLLTSDEEEEDMRTGRLRFDVHFLAERLIEVTDWVRADARVRDMGIGYFGASTGAAAALIAADDRPEVRAVVSRGGRPDLAGPALGRVRAPTLFIVGSNDMPVTEWNAAALEQMRCVKELQVIPGATHLFQEPGALERVAELAGSWFERYASRRGEIAARRRAG